MSVCLAKSKLLEILGEPVPQDSERLVFQGVVLDFRRIQGGELFVALPDGRAYVQNALDQGAALCLVESPFEPASLTEPERVLVVGNALEALGRLAAWWRRELGLPLVAIAASSLASVVKELTAVILLKHSRGTYSYYDNPSQAEMFLTLCQANREHAWMVLEMPDLAAEELPGLVRLVAPDVGVVLGAQRGSAHVESELREGLEEGSTLIVDGDDECAYAALRSQGGTVNLLCVGSKVECEAQVLEVRSRGLAGIKCRISLLGEEIELESRLLGKQQAFNLAAAALTAKIVAPQLSAAQIQAAVSGFVIPRSQPHLRVVAPERVIVDGTCYFNPDGMSSLFELAQEAKTGGREVGLLLGGNGSLDQEHLIVRAASELRPAFIVAVGEIASLMEKAREVEGLKVFTAPSPQAAAHILHKLPFNVLFAKGSREIGLDKTVEILLELEGEMSPQGEPGFNKVEG
ncbi:MAG: hypothetical protein GX589_02020 [Deltaproteobacteria bacterium]|nr:hypothetical protein [Deltaproteobacteria bacterium]